MLGYIFILESLSVNEIRTRMKYSYIMLYKAFYAIQEPKWGWWGFGLLGVNASATAGGGGVLQIHDTWEPNLKQYLLSHC